MMCIFVLCMTQSTQKLMIHHVLNHKVQMTPDAVVNTAGILSVPVKKEGFHSFKICCSSKLGLVYLVNKSDKEVRFQTL